MIPIQFEMPERDFEQLQEKYHRIGKNNMIGELAVEIAKIYLQSIYPNAIFHKGKKGVDLIVEVEGNQINYEIKGTESVDVAFDKLKVSSKDSHAALVGGMKLLRVSNVRNRTVNLYILEHGVHFELVEEPRWRVKRIK
jgi:hypothetical protein